MRAEAVSSRIIADNLQRDLDAKKTELDDLRNQQERDNYTWKKKMDEKLKQANATLQQDLSTLQQQLSEVQGYWDDAAQPLERVRPDDSTDKNSDLTVDKEALKVRFQSGEEQPNGELLRLQHELFRLQHELQQEREQSSRLRCANNTFREREAARFLREREADRTSKSSSLRRVSGVSSDGSPMRPYEFDSSPP
jgi:dynactin complex subunit